MTLGLPPLRVLLVEDNADDAALIVRQLERVYAVEWKRVENETDLRIALQEQWGVILIDHALPNMDAPQALALAQTYAPAAPALIVSGAIDEARAVELVQQGAVDYLLKDRLVRLETAITRAIAVHVAFERSIETHARMLEAGDRETAGHAQRVTEMTVNFARRLGLSEAAIIHIRRGALLHDTGKIGVPHAILHKQGKLDPHEWAIMQRHPQIAYDLFKDVEQLAPAIVIPWCHHEHWNGGGYPQGLAGEAIPFFARVFAVCDVYDALTSDRSYHKAISERGALAEIARVAGTTLDPTLAACFIAWKKEGRL